MQHSDFRITVSMDEYVKSKLCLIEVPRGYLSNTKEISDGMLTNAKGVNGGLGWLASTGRPDMAAPHSIIPPGYDRRSPQLISEVNAAVKQCHAVPITITIWPIPFAELRWTTFTDSGLPIPFAELHWTTFTDSGFDTGERQRHQQGWLVCATNKYFNQERSAPVSVLHWRSRKLTRKAAFPQLVETCAASSAVVEVTWIKALWESMTWRDFDILTQRRSSRPLKTMMLHVIRKENPTPKIQPTTIHDRKSALEVPIIEEFLGRAVCRPRWCPHNRNAADAMAKFKGAHSEPLFTLLRTGMYTLKGEKSELADRATLRQVGTVPRHKVSAVKSVTERVFLFICHRIEGISFRWYVRAGPCRIWFLLHRHSFIHDVSSADP